MSTRRRPYYEARGGRRRGWESDDQVRAPPYNLSEPDPTATFARGLALIDAAGAQRADLVCLPETFAAAGLSAAHIAELAEPIDGPSLGALAERARANRVNLVAGAFLKR